MNATPEQRRQIMTALQAVKRPAEPCPPDALEAYRVGLYRALYTLACAHVIPPEIYLSVEIVPMQPEGWVVRFGKDLVSWLEDSSLSDGGRVARAEQSNPASPACRPN